MEDLLYPHIEPNEEFIVNAPQCQNSCCHPLGDKTGKELVQALLTTNIWQGVRTLPFAYTLSGKYLPQSVAVVGIRRQARG